MKTKHGGYRSKHYQVIHGENYAQHSASERAECLFEPECKSFVRWLCDIASDLKVNKRLRRSPVVWAMYATFKKSRKKEAKNGR